MTDTETSKVPAEGEVVSQNEIENLLAMVGSEGDSAPATPGRAAPEKGAPQKYEFPSAANLGPAELRKLRAKHEDFIRSLTSRLSLHLRLECSLHLLKLETTSFRQFIEGLSSPTHLTLFKIEPFTGTCLIDMPLKLALSLVDRELGGPAVVSDAARELSKMETRLLSKIVEMILGEWCTLWRDCFDLRAATIRTESNGRFLQTHQPQTPMLVLAVEMKLAGVTETFQICLPCQTLEPLRNKLESQSDKYDNKKQPDNKPLLPAWNPAFDDMDIQLHAELPEVEVSARQLAQLKVGDVLPFSCELENQVSIMLESSPKFTGSLGFSGRQLAVQISNVTKR